MITREKKIWKVTDVRKIIWGQYIIIIIANRFFQKYHKTVIWYYGSCALSLSHATFYFNMCVDLPNVAFSISPLYNPWFFNDKIYIIDFHLGHQIPQNSIRFGRDGFFLLRRWCYCGPPLLRFPYNFSNPGYYQIDRWRPGTNPNLTIKSTAGFFGTFGRKLPRPTWSSSKTFSSK